MLFEWGIIYIYGCRDYEDCADEQDLVAGQTMNVNPGLDRAYKFGI